MDLIKSKSFLQRTLLVFLLLLFFISFSFSTCQTFEDVEFITQSGSVSYQSPTENNINVVNDNVSSHPLSIVLQKEVNEECHSEDDFALNVANTLTRPDAFQGNQNDDGTYTYIWRFEFSSDNYMFTNNYVQFDFVNTKNSSAQQSLSLKVDRQSPTINIGQISTDSSSYNINQVQESNDLKRGDILSIQVQGRDDIAVEELEVGSIQGGDVIGGEIDDSSQSQFNLESQVNLTSSPLDITFKVIDKFGKEDEVNMSVPFDSYDPSIQGLDIQSFEINSNKEHSVKGEVRLLDDFEISSSDVEIRFLSQDSNQVNARITSCEFDGSQESDLKSTTCSFSSDFVTITDSYDTIFDINVKDKVGNTKSRQINKSIEIDSSSPQINTFELRNSINNTNIVSSHNTNNATIVLEFSNDMSDLYKNMFDESSINSNNEIGFGTLSYVGINYGSFNQAEYDCELLDINSFLQRCEWNVPPEMLSSLEEEGEFNISIALTDLIGNGVEREITIEVDNSIPQISSFELVERGNERNTVFESYELVRMEVFVREVGERDLEIFSPGSGILFKDSPDDVSFRCEVVEREEDEEVFQRCFSDEFQLNKGFDGNRSELLNVDVITPAGNRANSSQDIKIFKINDNESVDYYNFKSSNILTPLNRRVVSQEGVGVFHSFSIEPKNNNEEYSIISVELLGMGDSINESIDVRLRNFELQNQTSQGVVLGDNNEFFIKSFMPRLLSAYEMEAGKSSLMISIIKRDIDTVYRDENLTVPLPIEFYDMPRDINSNIALAEKLLDDINGVDESIRNGESLYDIYSMYYDLCSTYNTVSQGIQSISQSWNIISLAFGHLIAGSEVTDEALTRPAKVNSMLGNIDDIMGKVCMLASCSFSQEVLGGALDSATGDFEAGSYLTGQKTFLGNMMCKR